MKPLAVIAAAALAGCAAGPDYRGPRQLSDMPPSFDRAVRAAAHAEAPVSAWWRNLGDPLLDRLIADSFAANRDLAAATANLRAARAVLRERRADFLPSGGVSATYRRERAATTVNPAFAGDRDGNFYSAGFDAAWEIDVFGRLTRRAQEARAAVGERTAERDDVLVSLAAEVADAYVQLRGAQTRLAVARSNAENQRESFRLTEALDRGGRGTALDIARAGAQLETTEASIPPLEGDVDVAISRLGVLTGRAPQALRDELSVAAPLPVLPETVAIGAPADLLRRRPDIRAAERALAGATARIGIAAADLFPTVSVISSASTAGLAADALFTGASTAFSIGPQLIWSLLDWPRIRARIAAADASADAFAAGYEQTVLTALEETENALSRFGTERARAARLSLAERQAVEAARLANLRYRNGIDNFLTVLDAERVKLESEDRLALSRIETARQYIALYKALGGGWESEGGPHSNLGVGARAPK